MGKAKKQVVDDDEAIFAEGGGGLKGARPYASPSMTRRFSEPTKSPPDRRRSVPSRHHPPTPALNLQSHQPTSTTDEAQKLKETRNFAKAASAYQQCIELVGASAPDAADLYAAKSQCHLMLRHWADVVADATRALKISPKNVDALVSRGRAYQATGQEKKAKVDAQAAAASDSSNEAAKALLESFEPKKAVAGLGGMSLDKPSKASKKGSADADAEEEARKKQAAQILAARQEAEARRQAQQRSWGPPVTVKAVAGADVRTFVVPTMIAHKDLMTALQKKFPDISAFTVRYSAPDGSLKNVNSRHDFATAVAAAQSGENKGKPAAGIYGGLHPVKLIISELTRLDAPPIADDGEAPAQGGAETSGQLAPNEVVEIDEWILDFAALFREHLGIDAEAHLDLHAEVRGSNPTSIKLIEPFLLFFLSFLFFSMDRAPSPFVVCARYARGDDEKLILLLRRIHR